MADWMMLLCIDDRLVDSLKNSPHTSTGTPRDDATPGTSEMSNFSGLHYQDGINPVCCGSECSVKITEICSRGINSPFLYSVCHNVMSCDMCYILFPKKTSFCIFNVNYSLV